VEFRKQAGFKDSQLDSLRAVYARFHTDPHRCMGQALIAINKVPKTKAAQEKLTGHCRTAFGDNGELFSLEKLLQVLRVAANAHEREKTRELQEMGTSRGFSSSESEKLREVFFESTHRPGRKPSQADKMELREMVLVFRTGFNTNVTPKQMISIKKWLSESQKTSEPSLVTYAEFLDCLKQCRTSPDKSTS